jgi:hypothetical protein
MEVEGPAPTTENKIEPPVVKPKHVTHRAKVEFIRRVLAFREEFGAEVVRARVLAILCDAPAAATAAGAAVVEDVFEHLAETAARGRELKRITAKTNRAPKLTDAEVEARIRSKFTDELIVDNEDEGMTVGPFDITIDDHEEGDARIPVMSGVLTADTVITVVHPTAARYMTVYTMPDCMQTSAEIVAAARSYYSTGRNIGSTSLGFGPVFVSAAPAKRDDLVLVDEETKIEVIPFVI